MTTLPLGEVVRALDFAERHKRYIENGGPLVELQMPDGKALGDYTGANLEEFEAWLRRVGERLDELQRRKAL